MISDNKIRNNNKIRTNKLIQNCTYNAVKCSHTSKNNSGGESYAHRVVKWEVCNWAYENRVGFATEVSFSDGGRCDVVLLDLGIGIEVLHSESIKDYLKKSYCVPTIPIFSSYSKEEIVEILDDLDATNGSAVDYYLRKYGVWAE